MTDLRKRLAEAHWDLYVSQARELSSCSHIPDTFAELGASEQAYHYRYADVMLSLPGIAITELPTESWPNNIGVDFACDVMATNKSRVLIGTDYDLSPDYARTLAAALLAAANATETATT